MRRRVGIVLIILFLGLVAFLASGCSQLSDKQSIVDTRFSELVPELTTRYIATKDAISVAEEVGGTRDVTTQGAQAIGKYEKALEDENNDDLLQAARELETIIGRLNSNAQTSPRLVDSQELKAALISVDEALPAKDVRDNYNKAVANYEKARSSIRNSGAALVGGYSASQKIEFWIPIETTEE